MLNGGDGAYQIGDFDGHVFTPNPIPEDRPDKYRYIMKVTETFCNKYNGSYTNYMHKDEWERFTAYAHQNFENAPDNRKIRIAWYPIPYGRYGMPFNQAMTIPTELKLKKTGLGVRLCYIPVKELDAYRVELHSARDKDFNVSYETGDAFDAIIEFAPDAKLNIRGYEFTYDQDENKLWILPPDKVKFDVPFVMTGEKVRLRGIFDKLMAEFFVGDGEIYLPLKPDRLYDGITAELTGEGSIDIYRLEKH